MGRRRLYHTPEEKKAAKAAKSKRSYIRHRDDINKQRRKKYHKHHIQKNRERETQGPVPATVQSTLESKVGFYLDRAKSIQRRLRKICGQNETAYLDNLCSTFIKENRQEDIESQISMLDKLQASIQKYENKIIFLVGIGSAYEVVNGIGKDVRKVLTYLEDILCAALLGVEEASSLWVARKFLHQAEGNSG